MEDYKKFISKLSDDTQDALKNANEDQKKAFVKSCNFIPLQTSFLLTFNEEKGYTFRVWDIDFDVEMTHKKLAQAVSDTLKSLKSQKELQFARDREELNT